MSLDIEMSITKEKEKTIDLDLPVEDKSINELIDELNILSEDLFKNVLNKKWVTKGDFSSINNLFEPLNKLGEETFDNVLSKYDPEEVLQKRVKEQGYKVSSLHTENLKPKLEKEIEVQKEKEVELGEDTFNENKPSIDVDEKEILPIKKEYQEQDIEREKEVLKDKNVRPNTGYRTREIFNKIINGLKGEDGIWGRTKKTVTAVRDKFNNIRKKDVEIEDLLEDLVKQVDNMEPKGVVGKMIRVVQNFIANIAISIREEKELNKPMEKLNILDYLEEEEDMMGKPIEEDARDVPDERETVAIEEDARDKSDEELQEDPKITNADLSGDKLNLEHPLAKRKFTTEERKKIARFKGSLDILVIMLFFEYVVCLVI